MLEELNYNPRNRFGSVRAPLHGCVRARGQAQAHVCSGLDAVLCGEVGVADLCMDVCVLAGRHRHTCARVWMQCFVVKWEWRGSRQTCVLSPDSPHDYFDLQQMT